MLFAKSDQELGCRVTQPLINFHNAKQILKRLQEYQYHKDAYDEARSMAGATTGVKSRIQAKFPLPVYTHCASHKLNLAIVAACKTQAVRNAAAVIGKVA